MDFFWIHMIVVITAALVGVVGGWCLRGGDNHSPDDSLDPTPEPKPKKRPTLDMASSIMTRLHQIAAGVAEEVGDHNERVQSINDELSASEDPLDVVVAVERLIKVNSELQSQLQTAEQRMREQASQIDEYIDAATTDALTQLANRRAFDDELAKCVEQFEQHGTPVSLVLLDVDDFKTINDTYGNSIGDQILRNLARLMRQTFSGSEITCRHGGDEFAIILPGVAVDQAKISAEEFRVLVARSVFECDQKDVRVTISGGVAELQTGEDIEEFIRRVDGALYISKQENRSSCHWHDGTVVLPVESQQTGAPQDLPQREEEPDEDNEERPTAAEKDPDEDDVSETPSVSAKSGRGDEALKQAIEPHVFRWKEGGPPVSVLLLDLEEPAGEANKTHPQHRWRLVEQFVRDHGTSFEDVLQVREHVMAVVLSDSLDAAIELAEKLFAESQQTRFADGDRPAPLHVGCAEVEPGDDAESLLDRSWNALEEAQRSGRQAAFYQSKDEECEPIFAEQLLA